MKTYLVSVTECMNPEEDINKRNYYVVPADSKENALDQIMRNLTEPMLKDGNGYPHVMEIKSPIRVSSVSC